MVLDDVVFNGRNPVDAIVTAVSGANPIDPQPVDRLSTPYLVFVADFDAQSADDAELRSYLTGLWTDMESELRAVFEHCVGFDGVRTADGFVQYVKRCQIETTMPFNDYWTEPLPAPAPLISLQVLGVLGAVLSPLGALVKLVGGKVSALAAVALLALLLWFAPGPTLWTMLGIAIAVILFAVLAYLEVMARGAKPFPTAPDADLRSILKALYLQQHFVPFAIRLQGANDETLHREFGTFLALHKPGDLDSPTQEPGRIRS